MYALALNKNSSSFWLAKHLFIAKVNRNLTSMANRMMVDLGKTCNQYFGFEDHLKTVNGLQDWND